MKFTNTETSLPVTLPPDARRFQTQSCMTPNDEPQFVDGHALVGLTGEFTAADGEIYQCRVTGTDVTPWDNDLLVIDYVKDGQKITRAMIEASAFRQD